MIAPMIALISVVSIITYYCLLLGHITIAYQADLP
jgi:hypothetical protein